MRVVVPGRSRTPHPDSRQGQATERLVRPLAMAWLDNQEMAEDAYLKKGRPGGARLDLSPAF